MKIKCANDCENLTINRLYHMMGEDDDFYYVVNDNAKMAKYPKEKFLIGHAQIRITKDAHFDTPNETNIWFVKGSIFNLQGRYKYEGKYMNVIQLKDNELPIAIPDNICEII